MAPEVEEIQQRVAAAPSGELFARRADLDAIVRRWCRGNYGQPLAAEVEFELAAIVAELRTRSSSRPAGR